MVALKVLVFVCVISVIGIASSRSTYETNVDGPCEGVEYRTKFNFFSLFMNVEEEIYCVGSDGNVVDCILACPQWQSGILDFLKYRPHIPILSRLLVTGM